MRHFTILRPQLPRNQSKGAHTTEKKSVLFLKDISGKIERKISAISIKPNPKNKGSLQGQDIIFSLSKKKPEMACRTALRFVFLAEPWRPVYLNRSTACASLRTRGSSPTLSLRLSSKFRTRDFHTARRTQLNCSHNETPSSSSDDQNPPQEAVLKAISGSPIV